MTIQTCLKAAQCPYVVYKVYGQKTRLSHDGSGEEWINQIIEKHSTAACPVLLTMDFANYVFGCRGYATLCRHNPTTLTDTYA